MDWNKKAEEYAGHGSDCTCGGVYMNCDKVNGYISGVRAGLEAAKTIVRSFGDDPRDDYDSIIDERAINILMAIDAVTPKEPRP